MNTPYDHDENQPNTANNDFMGHQGDEVLKRTDEKISQTDESENRIEAGTDSSVNFVMTPNESQTAQAAANEPQTTHTAVNESHMAQTAVNQSQTSQAEHIQTNEYSNETWAQVHPTSSFNEHNNSSQLNDTYSYYHIAGEGKESNNASNEAAAADTSSSSSGNNNLNNDGKQKGSKKKSSGGRHSSWLKIACLCLVFTLAGGSVGGYLASKYTMQNISANNDSSQNSSNNSSNANSESSASLDDQVVDNESKDSMPASSLVKTSNGNEEEMSASDIYTQACQQVVGITIEATATDMFGQSSTSTSAGTGFFITEDGYIITNYHVISSAVTYSAPITVTLYNGDTYEAEYVGGDSDNDVALLKINATGMNAVTMSNSNDMLVGDDVYVVGNALGELSYTLTSGVVSALDREITTTDEDGSNSTIMNMFQIDAAVNSGNSGGPVYNSKGQVIGIVTAKYSSTGVEGLGFAIPINDVISIVDDLRELGYVSGKPYAGLEVGTLQTSVAEVYGMPSGAYISGVVSGSAAEVAGLEKGDIITKLNDTEITSASDFSTAVKEHSAGDTVTITVYRNGEYLELSLTFGEKNGTETSTEASTESTQNYYGYGQPNYGYGQNSGDNYQ